MAIPPADSITLAEFNELLAKYPAVIKAVSDAKGSKDGQRTLSALDEYRYVEAPASFAAGKSGKGMSLEDVKLLVEWKLRHGKFRPTLMKLVSSNDAAAAEATIRDALAAYRAKSSAPVAVDGLTALKGIGPATASLLLAVHDPAHVPFLSDEIFYWLCADGKVAPIKYNTKEYRDLVARTQEVVGRLGVKAVDVERVAFVLFRGDAPAAVLETTGKASVSKASAAKRASAPPPKRKQSPAEAPEPAGQVRRSKRGKQA